MDDKKRGLSGRHVLMLSLALNVGLILKLSYVPETRNKAEQTSVARGFCFGENSSDEGSTDTHVTGVARTSSVAHAAVAATLGTGAGDDGRERVINLDHGDPTMYERYWQQMADKTAVAIPGWQYISYFSDVTNVCWFLEPDLAKAVTKLHKIVKNAITKDRYIVVGTGSSQLYQAALYALSPPNATEPMSVVSAAPYYSSYPLMTDFLESELHKWAGDAHEFSLDGPYIELVTSPNNPDGSTRKPVVNGNKGILIHDLAYYWPQYTPISAPADHDLMLFTVSKSTGHAGTRIGWALVKDQEVARKMTKYIEINTIGVSKDSQIRAAKILQAIADSYDIDGESKEGHSFFEYSYELMENRWKQLRAAVGKNQLFSLPDFPSGLCNFSGRVFESQPAFAWLKCEGTIDDCESFLRGHGILTRAGNHFGYCPKYVRVSILARDEDFDLFTERLSTIQAA